MSSRLETARMLHAGYRYADIIVATKLSSRTIARIHNWLQRGCRGYEAVLKTTDSHHEHTSPARAQ